MENLVRSVSALKGKRVLLTGDTGFKGAWLALWLAEIGAEVYGYALPPVGPEDHFSRLRLQDRIRHLDGDILDRETLEAFFRRAQPEFVFHLAAQSLVRPSYRDPYITFNTNVMGSVNVLDCVRACDSVRSFIYVTSDKCYKNNEWIWGYRETDALGGHDPYSASKAAAEIVFSSYGDSFLQHRPELGYASVRAGNVIGGGDWSEDRIVPDCIRSLRNGRPLIIRRPESTRPWQHVLEPLGGYILLAEALAREPQRYSGAWNFGPAAESTRTVLDLASRIVDLWGSGRVEIQSDVNAPHEAGLLHLNCDKARHLLGWRPAWDFDNALVETVHWYKSTVGMDDVDRLSISQINRYMGV